MSKDKEIQEGGSKQSSTMKGDKKPPEETLKEIYQDTKWHSWKCSCGCLNGRYNGNCGRCGGLVWPNAMFYGNDGYVGHAGIWYFQVDYNNNPHLVNNQS